MRSGRLRRVRPAVALGALGTIGACCLAGAGVAALPSSPGLAIDAGWAALAAAAGVPPVVAVADVLAALGASPVSVVLDAAVAAVVLLRAGVAPAACLVTASTANAGVVMLTKALVHRPGPVVAFVGPYGSFPSGHTAFAAVLATSCVLLLGRRALPWAAGAVVVMALSRTVLAAHWLTDTVVGGVEGVATTVLVWWLGGVVLRRVAARPDRDAATAPDAPGLG
ncbi:phosphatase PAP2 family protein [Amnibacterium sp. CER49]|uniref:phosphatase PAP2 family protein n=1 Tax=Amnibacterium sp. CER49 TaxID=3039161 RepID=UPI002448A8B5|nr:phosphatase PAP2 family protein [Amnibacterium sp. CER49]MDH2444802.1 phosphatase PAP2 family protein [Amnibacterium sp. CER49]